MDESPIYNPSLPVKVTTMGNVIEIQYMDRRNTKQTIQMLAGGEHYVECSTGEIKDVVHHVTRATQKKNLMRTFKTLRGLINANVTDLSRVRWITLTYRQENGQPMTDTKRLYKDFEKFNKRFQYHIKKMGYEKAEYITIAEPQASGAWHMHLLYIFDKTAPFLANDDEFNPLWGHGFTKIKKLKNVDNVGAYLTAYLGDIDFEEFQDGSNLSNLIQKSNDFYGGDIVGTGFKEVEIEDDNGNFIKKKYVKGARLPLYPAKFNIFRCSRGIKRPDIEMMSQEEAEEKVSAGTLTFRKTVKLSDENSDFRSVIDVRQYNILRDKNQ